MNKLFKNAAGLAVLVLAVVGVGVAATYQPDRDVAQLTSRWARPEDGSKWLSLTIPGIAQPIAVHYRDEGVASDPEPIVLLHGTSSSLHTWDAWVAQLKGTRRVVRLDLAGYGLTGPFADRVYSTDRYNAFLAAFAVQLKLPPSVWVGNSLGGQLAWELAVAKPRLVTKLVLVDSAGYPIQSASVPIAFQLARQPALRWITSNTMSRAMVSSSLRNVYGDPSRVGEALVDRYFDMTLRAGNRGAVIDSFAQRRAAYETGAGAPRIATIKQPTLVLWGAEDRLILPSAAALFKRDIPHAQVLVLAGLGHVPMEEDPATSLAAVRAFLGP